MNLKILIQKLWALIQINDYFKFSFSFFIVLFYHCIHFLI